jgi:hypothetical protein
MSKDRVSHLEGRLREQLLAAETGDGGGVRISRAAEVLGGRYATLMAVQIAAYLLVVVYVYPQGNAWLSIAVTAAFVIGLVATCRWYARSRQASSPGWPRRYSVAFAVTAGLFGAGVALLDFTENRQWWLWVTYAGVTALPLLVAGLWRRGQ